MNNQEEKILIATCQAGENKAFASIYENYINKIYRFVYYKTQDQETAQDLTSKTFLKALEKIKSFKNDDKANFQAWLYRIARNNIIDYYRTYKNDLSIEDAFDLHDEKNIEEDFINQEKINKVKKYLQKLNSQQRDVLILRIWEELSYKEISAIIGKNEASCKMLFSRTMQKLKKEMPLSIFISLLI